MARLAAHVYVRPGGIVGIAIRIVILLQVGGVAFGAHTVPVLGRICPVEPVIGL